MSVVDTHIDEEGKFESNLNFKCATVKYNFWILSFWFQPVDKTELLTDLKSRADTLMITELPTSQLYLIQRIANGAFGTVYKAEAENLPEYGSVHQQLESKKLVAAKYLPNTSEKDK